MLRNRGGTGAERTVGNVTFDPNGASGDEQELRNTGSTHGSQPATAQSPYNMHNTQRQGTGANANRTELVVVRHTGDPAEVSACAKGIESPQQHPNSYHHPSTRP